MRIDVVVVDTMTFAHLQALGQLDLLRKVGSDSKRLAVTKAVVRQVHRSGALGQLVQSFCDRNEVIELSPTVDDSIGREVMRILRLPAGRLVRRDRVDIELVEVARARSGGVMSRENGIVQLAKVRGVPALDLVALFAWAIRLRMISVSEIDRVTAPWATASAAGTGAPPDFDGTFSRTAQKRTELDAIVDALTAD